MQSKEPAAQSSKPKKMSAFDKYMASKMPKGFHMARVCDKNGCMEKAVKDGEQASAPGAAPQQEVTPLPAQEQAAPQAPPQGGNPMSAIDAQFNKWKKKKGITMTFDAVPPASHTVGGKVTGTPGFGG